jgi:DNA-binding transcriptional MerR regulator
MPKQKLPNDVLDAFSTQAAARISGLSVDMVNYMYRHKLTRPTGGRRSGRGVARKYAYADVLLLRVLRTLLNQGISVLALRKCMTSLQKRGGDLHQIISERFIATDGYNVYIGSGGVLEMLDSGQMAFAFVLELGSLRTEVDNTIFALRRAA